LEFYEKSIKNGFNEAKIKFIELKSKKILYDSNFLLSKSDVYKNKKTLGHFTHSIGEFEIENNNKMKIDKKLTHSMTMNNMLKQSYSSSQLGLLLLTKNEIINNNNNKQNLIYVN
jgi:hypothetical protein